MKKVSVIVPTIQKNTALLNNLITTLTNDESVGEIIIINNKDDEIFFDNEKVKVLNQKENLFVNKSWNLGVKESQYEIISLLNDDIIIPDNFCSNVISQLPENMGIAGMDRNGVVVTQDINDQIPRKQIKIEETPFMPRNFGVAMFFYKESYTEIPESLKIFCGDDWLFDENKKNGRKNYIITGQPINHFGSLSSGSKNFKKILRKDKQIYKKLTLKPYERIFSVKEQDRHYNIEILDTTIKINKQTINKIFSVSEEIKHARKYKTIKILGIKFRLKKTIDNNAKSRYYEYLECGENFDNNKFVKISESSYCANNSVKPIAFYLPQYHAIELNDKNFYKGFTDWSNAVKAIPQFVGHNQPQIPMDVGFYNLAETEILYRQIELAKKYGIYGFCFHYYWFSGKRLLEKPIFNYLNNKDLDFPFCFCWANENWSKRWDGGNKEVLMEQQLQDGDDEKFIRDIMQFFKDERYIKIDNKPVLIIYRLNLFEEDKIKKFIKSIKELAVKEGFNGVHLVGVKSSLFCTNPIEYGADASVEFPPHDLTQHLETVSPEYINKTAKLSIFDMKKYIDSKQYMDCADNTLYRTVVPSWDNTARKAKTGAWTILCEPDKFKIWLKDLIKWTQDHHSESDSFLFINAWNEWGEGAHLEPDTRYGYAYLQAVRDALEETSSRI